MPEHADEPRFDSLCKCCMAHVRGGSCACCRRKLYQQCVECRRLVRIDKPLIGSLHLCIPEES
jgi:hypothetical protein